MIKQIHISENLAFFYYKLKNNTMNSKIYFSLILIFFFLFGCGKDENSEESNETDIKTTAVFNPDLTYGTVTDQEGNIYKTIKIGSQTWMAENLRTTKYRNGDLIATTTPSTEDISQENQPKYQWTFDFNPGENNLATYGRMYTYYAVTDSRNVAPSGWHVSTGDDWEILKNFLGNDSLLGLKLKEVGTTHWESPNLGATNKSGFTALPGGIRLANGKFLEPGEYCKWWISEDGAYCKVEGSDNYVFIGLASDKKEGYYVRCVKNN